MNTLDALFPGIPLFRGQWSTVYFEPIIGSGERISIVSYATGINAEFKVVQTIRRELLDCLYGNQSENVQSMINIIISSIQEEFKLNKNVFAWVPPFDGITVSKPVQAADHSIDGILSQAVRFTSSLSSLALDAEREDEEEQPRRYSEQWAKSISDELKNIDPQLTHYFGQKVQLSETNILTSYGFLKSEYVANFGLLIPTRLSSSLNSIKAKIYDLESLKRSQLLIKPTRFEIIVGTPSFNDPTLTEKSVNRLQDTLKMVEELAGSDGVVLYRAESAKIAASHLKEKAA